MDVIFFVGFFLFHYTVTVAWTMYRRVVW